MVEERPEEGHLDAALAHTEPAPGHWIEPVYREHASVVLQTAYRVTGNAADAEDVLQTVFIRLARRVDPPDLSRGAVGYLRRAATNAALDVLQSRSIRAASTIEPDGPAAIADSAPTPERLHYSTEVLARIRQLVAGLSRRHAEIFTLRYFEGLDNQEIATIFDTTPGTVAVTLHRIRTRLMDELGSFLGGIQ